MPSTLSLGAYYETFIRGQLSTGRYADASDVVRHALRLLEEREQQLKAMDGSVAQGLADIEAGRVHGIDDVFDELDHDLAASSPSSQ